MSHAVESDANPEPTLKEDPNPEPTIKEDPNPEPTIKEDPNPEPTIKEDPEPIILNEDDYLMPIKEAIWDARSQWKDIGRKLGLRGGDIRAIHEHDDGECLHEVLLQWIHTGKASISDLLKALDSKVINRSDIAREILLRKGEDRTEVGLHEENSTVTGSNKQPQKEMLLMKPIALEELCALPLEDVWYQLGLWLGLDKSELHNIRQKPSEQLNTKWKNVVVTFEKNLQYSNQVRELSSMLFKCTHASRSVIPWLTGEGYATFMSEIRNNIDKELMSDEHTIKLYHDIQLLREKRIITAMVKNGLKKSVEEIKGVSLTAYLDSTDSASNPPECVTRYADYLKNKYQQMGIFPNDWPPEDSVDQHYTNLALVRDRRHIKQRNMSSTMEHDYIHGRIDNIVAMKESIELPEVFYPIINRETEESRLTILMDGAPGVGKTTITRKLCLEWARGRMLQEYHLVILIPVREMKMNEQGDIIELFPCESIEYAKELASYYSQNSGKRVLFIFDGYDEVHKMGKSERSLLSLLIFGKKLENCSILITSRPYASGYLRAHSRFNRHVEVLGFSIKKIKQCIQQNLSDAEQAGRLIQMLTDRLDIVSLCYIPLNCRIVLFVYKNMDYALPSTLTELYETFILHTIKRHAEKEESTLDGKETIYRAKTISKLPLKLVQRLNMLCELAFNGIKEQKLSFDDEELGCESLLNLGLLNSYQTITVANVQRHFQFLHLTIQEFLAARYVASEKFSPDDKIKFIRAHIDQNSFRMTLLFVAGLTKLSFQAENLSLIGEQVLDFNALPNQLSKNHTYNTLEDKITQKFLLCAHCAYEAQVDSSSAVLSQLIPIKSKEITISAQTISPFEELIIAHFLSSTTADNMWEKIDFGKCHLPKDSILFTSRHKIKTTILAIEMTKKLRVGDVPLSTVSPCFNTIQELSFLLNEVTHKDLTSLCEYLPTNELPLNTVKFYTHDNVLIPCVTISKKAIIVLRKQSILCSSSFNHFLHFVDYGQLQSISIPNQSTAFMFCNKCQQDIDILVTLTYVFQNSLMLISLDFSNCNLSSKTVNVFVAAIETSKNSSLNQFNLKGNRMKSVGILPNLFLAGTRSIILVCDYKLTFDGVHKLEFHQEKYNDVVYDTFTMSQESIFEIKIFLHTEIYFSSLSSFLRKNDLVKYLSLVPNEELNNILFPPGHNCKDVVEFASALCSHNHLERFSCPAISLSRESLSIQKKPIELNMCVASAVKILSFLRGEIKSISITDYPEVFQGLCRCKSIKNATVSTLCKLISSSQKFSHLNLLNCNLPEDSVHMIVKSLPAETSIINLHGNNVSPKSISKLLSNLMERKRENVCGSICVYGFLLTLHKNPLTLNVEGYLETEKDWYQLLKRLKLPFGINTLKLDMKYHFNCLETTSILLSNNPSLIQIVLYNLSLSIRYHSPEFISLIEALLRHKALQSLSCISSSDIVISREKLWLPLLLENDIVSRSHSSMDTDDKDHLEMCSDSLIKLLTFLKLKKVTSINIFQQSWAFHVCKFCKISKVNIITFFCKAIEQCANLQYLNLSGCNLPKNIVEQLSNALDNKKQLKFLYLDGNECGMSAFEAFLRLMFQLKLQHLHMENFTLQLCDDELSFDGKKGHSEQQLFLSSLINYCFKTPVKIMAFRICGVNLVMSDLYNDLFRQLLTSAQCSTESLTLDKCSIGSLFFDSLISTFNTSITPKSLSLHFSLVDSSMMGVFQSLARCTNIKKLSITSSDIAFQSISDQVDKIVTYFQAFFKGNNPLQVLRLKPCPAYLLHCLEDYGGLQTGSLRQLDLSDNFITDPDQIQVLKSFLEKTSTLVSLNLSSCTLKAESISDLAVGLGANMTLNFLTIDSLRIVTTPDSIASGAATNLISIPELWKTLFASLTTHKSLHTLSMCNIKLHFNILEDFIRCNKLVRTLKVEDCKFSKTQLQHIIDELSTREHSASSYLPQ